MRRRNAAAPGGQTGGGRKDDPVSGRIDVDSTGVDPVAAMTALESRRAAARRLPPYPCPECGAEVVDSWPHRCEPWALTDHRLDAVAAAIAHLNHHGLTPIIEAEAARSLWRRSAPERALVTALAELGGVASDC